MVFRLRENFAVRRRALVDAKTEFPGNERLDALEEKIVKLGTRLAADLDGIFKSGGRHECGAGALAFEKGICTHGCAVKKNKLFGGGNFLECNYDSLRWIGGRGEYLQYLEAARLGIDPDAVGERASSIDSDAKR